MTNREYGIMKLAQNQMEQFFRTPFGFLKTVEFNNTEEDKNHFCNLLGKVGMYATWGENRTIADNWYSMAIKVADERCEIA